MKDVIKTQGGEFVYISTCFTLDHGWETMVFACNDNGEVTCWADLDAEWYDTEEQASDGHKIMIDRWKQKMYTGLRRNSK